MKRMSLILFFCFSLFMLTACSETEGRIEDKMNAQQINVPVGEGNEGEMNFQQVKAQVGEGADNIPSHMEASFILYSLNLDNYQDSPIDQIPYYSRGEIDYLSEKTIQAFQNGSHPWLAHVETFVSVNASNLVPDSLKKDDNILSEYIQEKSIDVPKTAAAQVIVSDQLYYEVHMKAIKEGPFYITKIILHTSVQDNK